jgi:hypothetical protein
MSKKEMDDILKFGTEELFKDMEQDAKEGGWCLCVCVCVCVYVWVSVSVRLTVCLRRRLTKCSIQSCTDCEQEKKKKTFPLKIKLTAL